MLREFGVAFRAALLVSAQSRFWSDIGRALCSWPVALAIFIEYGLVPLMAGRDSGAPFQQAGWLATMLTQLTLSGLLALLLVPYIAHKLSPVIARAVAYVLRLDNIERPAPRLHVYVLWYGMLLLKLLPLMIVYVFLPAPFSWLLLALMGAILTGFEVRCALSVHAAPEQITAVLNDTLVRRVLVWMPVCGLPMFVAEELVDGVVGAFLPAPHLFSSHPWYVGAVTTLLIGLVSIVVFAAWTALSLQALQAKCAPGAPPVDVVRRQARPASPVITKKPARAPRPSLISTAPMTTRQRWSARILVTIFAVLIVSGARPLMLHHYWRATVPEYGASASLKPGATAEQMMREGLFDFACANHHGRIKTAASMGVYISEWNLGRMLACAAKHGHTDTVRVMIKLGAPRNYRTPVDDGTGKTLTPLGHAIRGQHEQLIKLLQQNGGWTDK